MLPCLLLLPRPWLWHSVCRSCGPSRLLSGGASLPEDLKLDLEKALKASKFQPETTTPLMHRFWRHFEQQQQQQQQRSAASAVDEADARPHQFVLMLPPPNVTGALHMGHALAFVIQDVLVRWQRSRGRCALWIPGFDHAGIATQVLMEKRLRKEQGLSRHQLGREKFVAEAAKWADEKRAEIKHQMELLGLALDWSEEYFTHDQRHSQVVTEAFVRLHDNGLIYRSEQLVNWSCALESAISDIEVESREIAGPTRIPVPGHQRPVEFGRLHLFEYPFAEDCGSSGKGVVVATTRPETMLGDTAVAVHPADSRYSALIGRRLRHPLATDGRHLPVVAHEAVDPDFGTGAVKLTPGHSRADMAMAQSCCSHSAPPPPLTVFTEAGAVGGECGAPAELVGMPRFAARDAVLARLAELGLYRGSREHSMIIPVCSRSGDVVEQLLKSQWFVRTSCGMVERTAEAVRSGRLSILPAGYAAEWLEWMRRATGDWCVSRQIWWGHRVPAYEVISAAGGRSVGWVAARSEAEAMERAVSQFGDAAAGRILLRRDPDVLDTWFSSCLLPLSLAGWPAANDSGDLDRRLPQSLLETGHDILFFWAARMVMLTEQLTGRLPFRAVLLNGLVCDSQGRKMSKSRGNVLDPLRLMGRGGADALRLALCCHRFQLDRVAFDRQLVDACARLLNKLWQSHRFLRPRLQSEGLLGCSDAGWLLDEIEEAESAGQLDKIDTWLLSRLASLAKSYESSFSPENMQLQEAANRLRHFWLTDFCDIGLECLKSPEASRASALVACLASAVFLRLLYPFCPHVCELLWLGAHSGGGDVRPLAAPPADWWHPSVERLQRWRSPGQEEVAGLAMDLLARCLDWRALLKPADPEACVLLYNSAKCPIDATLYRRLFAQVGRTPIQRGGGDGTGRRASQGAEPLLRLELCEGLHFAAPKATLRIDEAVKELKARRQRHTERRDGLVVQQNGDGNSGQTDAQKKKLAGLSQQIEFLTVRLKQLEQHSAVQWDW